VTAPWPARALGLLLGGAIGAILTVRRPRPIHSSGAVFEGELTVRRASVPSGIRGFDAHAGEVIPVIARVSRSAGLPSWLPDVYGLALRWEDGGRPVDVQLSATGVGVPGRFVLAPHLRPDRATLSSVVPYRTSGGPVLICARTVAGRSLPPDVGALRDAVEEEPWLLRLYSATPRGRWHPFADLRLTDARGEDDPGLRFDIDLHPLEGATSYDAVRAVRQPAYRLAQRR